MTRIETLPFKENFEINENDHLSLRGVDFVKLCDEYGTPLFVFDETNLVKSYERFRQAFEKVYPKTMVCYSIKTLPNVAICKLLAEKGAYAEVSSEQDLHIALKAGFSGDKIIYDGPFKPDQALRTALEEKVVIVNVESFREIERLESIAEEMGVNQSIGLRVNPFKKPNFFKSLHPNVLYEAGFCYPSSRFGFSLEEIHKAFERLKTVKNLRFEGLMMHPYHKALVVLLPLLKEASEKYGFEMKYFNMGGGFNPATSGSMGDFSLFMDYFRRCFGLKSKLDMKRSVSSIESIAEKVAKTVRESVNGFPEPVLVTEPGRFIAGASGVVLLRVDHFKMAGGCKWVLVDGGTNILPLIYERRDILVANRVRETEKELVNIVGPLLFPRDFLAIKTLAPRIKEDDIVAVFDCGAYSLSCSSQFLYPRPAAVSVDSEGKVRLIRKTETFDDVTAKDKV